MNSISVCNINEINFVFALQSYLDYKDLVSATEKISETATWVNESQRKAESQEKVIFYQENIIGLEEVKNKITIIESYVYLFIYLF